MNLNDLGNLLQKLDEKTNQYTQLNRYAAGEQPLTFLAPDVREQLNNRLKRVSINVPGLLVSAIAERLRVVSLGDETLWANWQANDLDQASGVAHREALVLGDCYALVWARPDGSPSVSIESAEQMTVVKDPGTGNIVAGVKRWEDGRRTHAVTYEGDVITRFVSDAPGATTTGFKVVEEIENPLGVPPLVHFRNGGRLLGDGVSEMADVLSLTDAVVKLTTDLLTSSEYAARPRRWATGLELAEDDDGNAVNPIGEGDRMMINESSEGKFGQLPGADLAGYESGVGVIMRQISAVSGLPEHMLGIGGDNPTSADSIRASEAALTARAEAKQKQFGRAWESVGRLMVAVRDGADPASVDVRIQWADPSTRSAAQEADSVTKLFASGLLPASYALKRLGYTDDEIAEIRTARRVEALDSTPLDPVVTDESA